MGALRLFVIAFCLVLFFGGVFFVYEYYVGQQTLMRSDPLYAAEASRTVLNLFLAAGLVATVTTALLVYMLFSTRTRARKMAYGLAKDLSFSKEQFRRFYELSPVPYMLITPEGKITRPNKASIRFLGMPEDQLTNKNLFAFLTHPDHPDKIGRYRARSVRHIPIEQKEVQVTLATGGTRWALLSIEDLTEPGQPHQGLVTLVDIHEQKELDRIKTEFLSLASHQLRAPLSNLKWYIDFLLKRRANALTEEVSGYLHKMYRRNEDMIDLVNTLLNMSRIEMGRLKVQKEQTDLSELAESVIEELLPKATDKQITLNKQYEEAVALYTDRRLVRIILQNLLTNALRYTPDGGAVFVRMQQTEHGVVLEVEDTGVGIPPEEQSRIFQKLYRATNAQQIEVNGNGIGLYMCKALAEGMGGSISFASTMGKGTTFTVDLPGN